MDIRYSRLTNIYINYIRAMINKVRPHSSFELALKSRLSSKTLRPQSCILSSISKSPSKLNTKHGN